MTQQQTSDTTTTPPVGKDGEHTLVPLYRVPALLEAFFDLEVGTIDVTHVYVWWDRSKRNIDIAVPMPAPEVTVGRSNAWRQDAIIHWYAAWKDLDVPWCREAGDRIDSRGHDIPSMYRTWFARAE